MAMALVFRQKEESSKQEDLENERRYIEPVCDVQIALKVVGVDPVFEWAWEAAGEGGGHIAAESCWNVCSGVSDLTNRLPV